MQDLRELLPLAGVFLVVIGLTLGLSFIRADYTAMSMGKTFMAMFFLVFGSFKIYNLEGFREAFESYDPVAERFNFYSLIYPFIEVGLGILYLVMVFFSLPSIAVGVFSLTIVVMVLNASGVFHALINGRDLQCACLGNVFNVPMTWVTLGEDLLMAGMAVWMLFSVV